MDRLHISPYDGTHVQYQDPVTSFPDKMDELLIALNKVRKKIVLISFYFYIEFWLDLYGYKTSWYIRVSSTW